MDYGIDAYYGGCNYYGHYTTRVTNISYSQMYDGIFYLIDYFPTNF